uniref:Uncharacterized protein n=1 Tax=Ixodes ricinus TaxID=34613 RepID=A0A6B0UGL0_IXORI
MGVQPRSCAVSSGAIFSTAPPASCRARSSGTAGSWTPATERGQRAVSTRADFSWISRLPCVTCALYARATVARARRRRELRAETPLCRTDRQRHNSGTATP